MRRFSRTLPAVCLAVCWHALPPQSGAAPDPSPSPTPVTVKVRMADGFDQPVGKPDGEGYYTSRGFLSYHPGEDWNGLGGGNTDLGDPVYAIGHGYVTFAHDARMGWGNVILIRHAFIEKGKVVVIDSMYAHLNSILVKEGQQVVRGQKIGTIGTNHGMYEAHLHFEIRKNLRIGINRSAYRIDFTNYYRPGAFISTHRKLDGGGRTTTIEINTYLLPKTLPSQRDEGSSGRSRREESRKAHASPTPHKFRVNRYDDLNW